MRARDRHSRSKRGQVYHSEGGDRDLKRPLGRVRRSQSCKKRIDNCVKFRNPVILQVKV